jgi:hypothetical protein
MQAPLKAGRDHGRAMISTNAPPAPREVVMPVWWARKG